MTAQEIETRLRDKVAKDLATEERSHQIHLAIREVLKHFVGKKLTKRFTDKVTAAVSPLFPTPPVCFYPYPGRLAIWHTPSIPYDQRELFFIAPCAPGYQQPNHSVEHPTLEGFDYEDQSHGDAAAKRIKERRLLLSVNSTALHDLAIRIESIRWANAQLRAITEPFDSGLRYEAERLVNERSLS